MTRLHQYVLAAAVTAAAACPTFAQAPAAAPPSRGTAVFNVARVMKDYQKWQYFAEQMNKERTEKGGELAKIRNEVMKIEKDLQGEQMLQKKAEMEQKLIALQRAFDDKERQLRKEIDEKSATHLRTLFAEIRTVVDAVAKTNGFELVMAYPDALTQEDMNSPVYFEMKLRPGAAMPFYVSPSIDITKVVVDTLNKNFPAPGPVSPAGATAPAAPGTPPAAPGGNR